MQCLYELSDFLIIAFIYKKKSFLSCMQAVLACIAADP